MNAKVGSLSGNPACEAGKLIVEVIGKDHPPEQRVVIYDETDHELQEWLTQQAKQELVADSRRSSTLHIWDWQQQPKRHLWLEIEAERGSPIRVPLMDDTRSTPRQRERQWNCIVPVVPMSTMLGISANHQHREYPVHVRPGFIYLFYRGKVWRELEIRQAEGQVTYHDVRLSDVRNGEHFRDGARTATGKGLSEIWLPARWNNRAAPDIEVAYAEVQWPAVRLNAMERNARLRRARCNRLGLAVAERSFGNTTYRAPSQQQAFYLHNVPAHRLRDPAREWLFDQPLKYLHDLSGQYPVQSQQYAQQVHQRHERGESNPGPSHPQQTLDDLRPETGAWTIELSETLNDLKHVCAVNEREHWQAAPAATDMLATAKRRQIAGVLLDDGLYRMRHLLLRTNQALGVLQLCAQRATFHAHHASALLLQRMMVPPQIGGQSNPLHRFISQVSQEGRQQIDLCSGHSARLLAATCLKAAQDNLAACLAQVSNQHALGDHFCLEGLDYAGAFQLCSQLFVCLARTADQQDPFLAAGDAPRASAGRRLLCKIAQNTSQPLHQMLWPEANDDTLLKPYQAVQTPNNGEGHYRADALNQVAQLNAPPGEEPATLEGSTLAGLMQQPDFLLLPSAKSGAAALITVWENLSSALKEAQKGLSGASTEHAQAADQSRRRRLDVHDHERDLHHEQERSSVLKEELGNQAFPAKYRLYTKDLQMLRSMLQQDFGEMVFIRRTAANQKNYYFFGLTDLPAATQNARRIFGELLDMEGQLLASSNGLTANRAGIDQQAQELLLLAIPKNHRTARLISALNRQIAEELRIQNDLQQARERREAARGRLSEANNALKQAQERLAQQERGWRRSARGLLGSKAFPAGVLILEFFNVQAEFEAFSANARNKGMLRGATGIFSSGVDLVLAMEFLADKTVHNHPLVQSFQTKYAERVVLRIPPKVAEVFGQKLITEITGKLAFQSFAGTLFVGISIYDAMHEASLGDDAAWGYGLMAAGGLVGVVGGFFTASGATFLGLGPVGWATLLLILAGAALVWWLDDSPIEEWLTNGPFGNNRSDEVSHLWNDPQEAFYRLVSLFACIRIRIGANPKQARCSGAMGLLDPAEYHAMRRSNTQVRIESNLPGLAATLGSANISAVSQLRSSSHRLSPRDMTQSSSHSLSPIQPLAQRLYPDALELFYEVPVSQSMPRTPPHRWQTYTLAVRAQVILQGEDRTWAFPAPLPTDVLRYNPDRHDKPEFSKTNRPFWADEQTHPDSQP
ncbi:hypothetical protein [Stutzerimonas degradans]|uniref:Uncharacterized protein n=1 Tax=Stutzerimonas degradans TaxID=2968968 RepID=A0A8E2U240_9GAMM|nr:hypothetical protein [Stutzerimonas degradans]MCQ4276801.1 hypothetical protein [Stutzerimonas degradans]PNF77620.1 hypothetical protein CXK95_08010 [Stutzerimonas degradans]QPT20830.1 hypothetical protein I6G33_14295 [Stutzerimonas degradans]